MLAEWSHCWTQPIFLSTATWQIRCWPSAQATKMVQTAKHEVITRSSANLALHKTENLVSFQILTTIWHSNSTFSNTKVHYCLYWDLNVRQMVQLTSALKQLAALYWPVNKIFTLLQLLVSWQLLFKMSAEKPKVVINVQLCAVYCLEYKKPNHQLSCN